MLFRFILEQFRQGNCNHQMGVYTANSHFILIFKRQFKSLSYE